MSHYTAAEHALADAAVAAAGDQPAAYVAAQARATLAVAEQLARIATDSEQHHRGMAAGLLHLGKRLDRIADALGTPAPAGDPCGRFLTTGQPCPGHQPRAYAAAQADAEPAYPRQDGEVTVIGPECFADAAGRVISWRGQNYKLQTEPPRTRRGVVRLAVKTVAEHSIPEGQTLDLARPTHCAALARGVDNMLGNYGHSSPGYGTILGRLHRAVGAAGSWEVDNDGAIEDTVAAILGDTDVIKAAVARAEAAEPEPAAAEEPAGFGDLTARQRAVVRAAIDQCAERYEARGDILNVFDRRHRGDVATGIALAVSSAGLGQPDWHYLDDVIRRHLAGGGFNVEGWPMDTENARAALTELLCAAPPEPWQHPVIRRRDAEADPEPPAHLADRQRVVVRQAIDQRAEEYTNAGGTLDVCVDVDSAVLTLRIAQAVSAAGLGQPDSRQLSDVIRAEVEREGYAEWLMDTPEARAALTGLLCDAPPEPWQHPVIRRAEPAVPDYANTGPEVLGERDEAAHMDALDRAARLEDELSAAVPAPRTPDHDQDGAGQ